MNGLWLVVSIRFQDLFHSASAVLFTFPSRYWFTIGQLGVFSLTGWSRLLPTGFHVPRRTQDATRAHRTFDYRACTFSGRFRSPLLRESLLFSFPPATKMFQFTGLLSHKLCIHLWIIAHYRYWVSSFGYLRIIVYLPLPEAFRR